MSETRRWRQIAYKLSIFFRVCGLLLALRVGLPCIKLQTLLQWLTPSGSSQGRGRQALVYAVWCTDALLRLVFPRRGKCLPRTLTLYYFATRSGCPVHVHCGVQRHGDTLQGHAWLSLHGLPFLEESDPMQSYAMLFSFPSQE